MYVIIIQFFLIVKLFSCVKFSPLRIRLCILSTGESLRTKVSTE